MTPNAKSHSQHLSGAPPAFAFDILRESVVTVRLYPIAPYQSILSPQTPASPRLHPSAPLSLLLLFNRADTQQAELGVSGFVCVITAHNVSTLCKLCRRDKHKINTTPNVVQTESVTTHVLLTAAVPARCQQLLASRPSRAASSAASPQRHCHHSSIVLRQSHACHVMHGRAGTRLVLGWYRI